MVDQVVQLALNTRASNIIKIEKKYKKERKEEDEDDEKGGGGTLRHTSGALGAQL